MRARRAVERIWSWLGERQRAVEVLVALLFVQLTAFLLPQSPVPATQSTAYTQWVTQLRPALGDWVRPLNIVGLLAVRSSLLIRVVLAFLGLLVAVRIDYLRESWHSMQPVIRRGTMLFCIGSLFVIAGWAAQMLWGWAVPEIVNWPNTPITIAEHNISLSPKTPKSLLWTEKYGVYLIRTGWTAGLDITATDEEGTPLSMLRSSKDELYDNLQVIMTGTPPEAFFLTPETELVYRLYQAEDKYDAAIFAQVYRSASGDLLAEKPLVTGEDLVVETTHISITRLQLPRYRVLYNPGAPVEIIGLIFLLVCVFMQTSTDYKSNEHTI
jgi:hypothetical protein